MTTFLPGRLRTMYDSDRAADIPTDAQMVAGYIDGVHPWSHTDWQRFGPSTVRVRIARNYLTRGAHVLDSENGLATVGQTVAWVAQEIELGRTPGVYCNVARWPALRETFRLSNVREPWYWVAHWGLTPRGIPLGALGCQYASPLTSGGHYDLSLMAGTLPGVDRDNVTITGNLEDTSMGFDLSTKLPDPETVRGSNTVAEALTAGLVGVGGVRHAGATALDITELAAGLARLAEQLQRIEQHLGITS